MKVPKEIIKELEKIRIKVIVENTKEAVKIFNEYVEKNKKVVCAVHLTC